MQEHFSKIIRKRMIDMGIIQAEIARRLGVRDQKVSDVIYGRIRTSYVREGIQRILGLDASIWNSISN